MNEVKLFKFASGEEVVAEVVERTPNTIKIKNPLNAVVQPDQRGGISYGFIPWVGLTDGNLEVYTDKLILEAEPRDEVINSYNTQFGNIVTPSKKIIV